MPIAEKKTTQMQKTKSQEGTMFGVPAETVQTWSNAGYMVAIAIAAVLTFLIYQSSSIAVADKQRELEAYKADADVRVATARKQADEAKSDAAQAIERAAALEVRAATLEREAAALQQQVEQARLEQRRIEASVGWRTILPGSGAVLLSRLAAGVGGSVEISYPANDPEALYLASEITNIVERANAQSGRELWHLTVQPRQFSLAIYWDVRIFGQQDAIVRFMQTTFSDAGLRYITEPVPNLLSDGPGMVLGGIPASDVTIFVGSKRPPN